MSKNLQITSSISQKIFMALTGAFLVTFLLVHLSANLLVIGGRDIYNEMTHFMGTFPLIQAMQPVLALGFILHICYGVYISWKNSKARPINYKKTSYDKASSWASRYMWLTGIIILFALVIHIANYFIKIQFTGLPEGIKDDYELVVLLFRNSMSYTIAYIIWFIFLGIHLAHGFWSMFQTTGQAYVKWLPVLKVLALIFCFVITTGFTLVAVWCRYVAEV